MKHVTLKRKILRSLFGLQIIIFGGVYFFGSQGLTYLWQVKQENNELGHQLSEIQAEVDALQNEISDWTKHPFYQEKVAREQLQMARADETIYYIP